MIKLELPRQIEDRLDLLSLRTGHTRHYYVMEALLEYLDDIEARQDHFDRVAESQARTQVSGKGADNGAAKADEAG